LVRKRSRVQVPKWAPAPKIELDLNTNRISSDPHPKGVPKTFKRLSTETDVHVNPHKFRHTFATRALSAGVDVMALRKALAHTTLIMVGRYVHYQKDDLLDAWRHRRD
jgi:integrase